MKQNCWEYNNCGRQPGGSKVDERGVCPAAINVTYEGNNDGENAGRYCWKVMNCTPCNFFKQVEQEEESNFVA